MTSYIDHHPEPRYIAGKAPDKSISHSWRQHTEARLLWLYGPSYHVERAAQTQADIAAWRRLGTRTAA